MMEIRHKNRLKERGCIKDDMSLSVGGIRLMNNSCIIPNFFAGMVLANGQYSPIKFCC